MAEDQWCLLCTISYYLVLVLNPACRHLQTRGLPWSPCDSNCRRLGGNLQLSAGFGTALQLCKARQQERREFDTELQNLKSRLQQAGYDDRIIQGIALRAVGCKAQDSNDESCGELREAATVAAALCCSSKPSLPRSVQEHAKA